MAIPGIGTLEDANPSIGRRYRWDSETRLGARSDYPLVKSSMDRLDATNKQIARTKKVWQPRLGRGVTDEEARQITHDVTGLFSVLADWSRAERLTAANDNITPGNSGDGEVRCEG
jgi:hypothetical protein